VLLDVITNPNEVAIPGKVKLKQAWGFTVSKIEEWVLSHGDS
jgi:pyruvate dehydrogenase (quinone)